MENTKLKKGMSGFTLIEAMIAVSVSAMVSVGTIKYAADKIEDQAIDTLSSKVVSIVSAIDQRVFIDKYDQALWPAVTDYITNNQVQQFLQRELIANTATCGVAGGWVPVVKDITDANEVSYKEKLKLISCDLFQGGKIELDANSRVVVEKSATNITGVNLYLSFATEEEFTENFQSLKRVLKKTRELDTKNITGSHDYGFVNMAAPNPSQTSFTTMECLNAKQNCGFMARYSADGEGTEYLDVMGSNSMVNTKIKFSDGIIDDVINTCFTYQWNTGTLEWERLSNIDCGIGIDPIKNNQFVEADVHSISAERVSLNKKCTMAGIPDSIPCGLFTDNSTNTVVGLFDDIHAINSFATLLDVKNIEAETVTVNGSLKVNGSAEITNLTVTDVTTFLSDVSLEGINDVTEDLNIHGKATIDNLNVVSTATFEKDLKINGYLDVNNGYVEAEYLRLGTISKNDINKNCSIENAMKILRTGSHSEPVICAKFKDIDGASKQAWKLANARIGQVLPFDGSCPDGFDYFEAAAGRFLVGSNEDQLDGLTTAQKNALVASGDAFLDKSGNIIKYDVGDKGGSAYHVLTEDEMPIHNHKVPDIKASCSGTDCAGYAMATVGAAGSTVWSNANEIPTGAAGGNQAHENRPPYYTVNYCIYSGK